MRPRGLLGEAPPSRWEAAVLRSRSEGDRALATFKEQLDCSVASGQELGQTQAQVARCTEETRDVVMPHANALRVRYFQWSAARGGRAIEMSTGRRARRSGSLARPGLGGGRGPIPGAGRLGLAIPRIE